MVVSNALATAYGNQKKGLTLSNGYQVIVYSDTGTNAKFKYSVDNGINWVDYAADIAGWANGSIASYVDSGGTERIVAVWKQSGTGGGRVNATIYCIVGTFNAGRTTITWGSAVAASTLSDFPDLVVIPEGTGAVVHQVESEINGGTNYTTYRTVTINSSGVPGAYVFGSSFGPYGNTAPTYPSIDIDLSTKRLHAAWSAGTTGAGKGTRYRTASYSAGVWTWAAEVEVDNAYYIDATSGLTWMWMNCRWDGTRVVIGGLIFSGVTHSTRIYDSTNFTAFTLRASSASDLADSGGIAVDSVTGDVYLVGQGTTYNDFGYWKVTRSGSSLSIGPQVITEQSYQNAPHFVRSWFSNSTLRWVYVSGNNSPYQVKYDQLVLNVAPSTPTNLARTSDATDTTPLFSADISDPNTSQQIKARFEIQTLAGAAVGTVDSSFRTGAGTVTAEYSSALAVGQYKVRAQTIDDLGLVSAQTAFVNFDVTQTVTKDETLKWDVRQYVFKDVSLLWDVLTNNSKELTLLWNVYQSVAPKDITLLWSVEPVWVDVPYETVSPTWQEVAP